MGVWITLSVGLALGGVIGWLWATARANARLSRNQIEAEARVSAVQNMIAELRANIGNLQASVTRHSEESAELRERLKGEAELKAAAETEIKHLRGSLEDAGVLRERLQGEAELRVAAETQLKEAMKNLDEQKRLLDEARTKLADAFSALSAEALSKNNDAFLKLAKGTFEKLQAEAKGDLEVRQKAIDGLVLPLKDVLDRYEKQVLEMEKTRQAAYGALDEQLKTLATANQNLQKETGSLVTALRTPQVRGRWGEMTLRRVAELAGMSEHCDFTEQETLDTEEGRLRPDMIVNLPGSRRIVVDAKVPLQAFLDAASATSESEREGMLARHGQLVRAHMNQLAARGYWQQFDQAPEVVVLFLPGESFFAAALQQDRTLIEDAMAKRVFLATPTTLIAFLRTVAFGWRQERIEKNAQEISELGKQLYDRIRIFVDHMTAVGSALGKAVESYNNATGSLVTRVLPAARRFKELGAAVGDDISELEGVDRVPRAPEVSSRSVAE